MPLSFIHWIPCWRRTTFQISPFTPCPIEWSRTGLLYQHWISSLNRINSQRIDLCHLCGLLSFRAGLHFIKNREQTVRFPLGTLKFQGKKKKKILFFSPWPKSQEIDVDNCCWIFVCFALKLLQETSKPPSFGLEKQLNLNDQRSKQHKAPSRPQPWQVSSLRGALLVCLQQVRVRVTSLSAATDPT